VGVLVTIGAKDVSCCFY